MEKDLSMNGGLLSNSPLCSNVCDQHFDGIIKYSSYLEYNSKQCRDHLENLLFLFQSEDGLKFESKFFINSKSQNITQGGMLNEQLLMPQNFCFRF